MKTTEHIEQLQYKIRAANDGLKRGFTKRMAMFRWRKWATFKTVPADDHYHGYGKIYSINPKATIDQIIAMGEECGVSGADQLDELVCARLADCVGIAGKPIAVTFFGKEYPHVTAAEISSDKLDLTIEHSFGVDVEFANQ